MMNAWIRKEAKDILRWTPIGVVILSLLLWIEMRSLFLSNAFTDLSSKLCFQAFIAAGVFGVFLGVASFWFDSSGGARGYMVQRGISLARVFTIRTILGFIAFMVSMWTPLLCCGFYISMIGPATLPITPFAIVPALIVVLFTFGFFFAGSLIACRTSRWFGARLLPLLCALPLPMAVLPVIGGHAYAFLVTGLLGVIGMLLIMASARSAFLRGPSQPAPSRSFCLPAVERTIILLSTLAAAFIVFALVMATTMRGFQAMPATRMIIRFESDGAPWLVEQPTLSAFLGKPHEQARVVSSLQDDSSDGGKPDSNSLQFGTELFPRFSTLSSRVDTWDMIPLKETNEYLWFGNRGLVYFYRKLNDPEIKQLQLVAVVGPKSVGDHQKLPKDRFEGYPIVLERIDQTASQGASGSFLFSASGGVYRFDIATRVIEPILPQPIDWYAESERWVARDDEGETQSGMVGGKLLSHKLLLMNDYTMSIVEHETDSRTGRLGVKPIATLDIPRNFDLKEYRGAIFWFQDEKNWTFIPLTFAHNYNQREFLVIRSQNDVVQQSRIQSPVEFAGTADNSDSYQYQEQIRVMLLLPPVLVSSLSLLSYFVLGGHVPWNSIWLLGLLQAFVSGVLCLIAARFRLLSRSSSALWFLLGALFGLGTWGALLAIYPRVYRLKCSSCGRMRRIENDHCEECGASWEPLKPLGIELLGESVEGGYLVG
ncbi:hypothetical protein SH449x_004534 [Pirellulaceae bacterium SH449]